MASGLDPRESGPGLIPGEGYDCVVFLAKTLSSHSTSKWVPLGA